MAQELLTQAEVARRLGVDPRHVARLAQEGMPKKKSRYPWPEARRWRDQQLVEKGRREVKPTDESDARARKLEAEARLAEIEVAKAEGEVLAIGDVEREVGAVFDRLRARCRAIPGKYTPRVIGLRTLPEAQTVLDDVARELVADLADTADDLGDDALPDDTDGD